MFFHLYSYGLKVLLKNKVLLFWSGIFPFILGTFFVMAFSNITEKTESMDGVHMIISMDENSFKDESLIAFFTSIEDGGYMKLSYMSKEDALKSVSDKEYTGIIFVEGDGNAVDLSIEFKETGINQTIIKNIVNSYVTGRAVMEDVLESNPQNTEAVMKELFSEEINNVTKDINSKNMDTFNQYYFALFAMTCMFGSSFGLNNTVNNQADQSFVGIRKCVSPAKKLKIILSEYCAAVTIEMGIALTLLIYLTQILKIDLGDKYGYILLTCFVASLFGVSLGYFIGVVIKGKQAMKESIISAVVLFLNFLAGLMLDSMKHIIEIHCPVVNRINPAAIITDCFYSLCVFEDMNKYVINLCSLVIWTVVLSIISLVVLRREKYANL